MKRNVSYLKGYLFSVFTLAVILCSTSAFGAIIRVPGDQPTIQTGIYAASTGDTVLVAHGTYTGTGNKWLDFLGKAITVLSDNGPHCGDVTQDGEITPADALCIFQKYLEIPSCVVGGRSVRGKAFYKNITHFS